MKALNNENTKTQANTILKHLKDNPDKGITPKECARRYYIFCLAERIRDLRKRGYDIETIMHREKQKNGTMKIYGQYVLRGEA